MTIEPWVAMEVEPWTPVDAEKAMRWVLRAMLDAQHALKDMRDAEVKAKHAFESAKRKAFYDEACPVPTRGGFTVADREAFIETATAEERQEYELATSAKEAAQDHLRTLNSQSVVIAALAKNVQQTFSVIGAGR